MKTGTALLIIAAVFFSWMGYDRYQTRKAAREAAIKAAEKRMSECRSKVDIDLAPAVMHDHDDFLQSQAMKQACVDKMIEEIKGIK